MDTNTANQTPFSLDLNKLISTSDRTAWVDFRDGVLFQMSYCPASQTKQIAKECTVHKYNPSTRNREGVIDNDRFIPQIIGRIVKNWKGLTPNKLALIIPIDLDRIPKDKRDVEIAYDSAQMVLLVKNSSELDNFLSEVSSDLKYFQSPSHEEEMGNSEASQSGN